jgi:hypothetical protein
MYVIDKNAVSVPGICEGRWKGQSEIRSGDYTVYYSEGETGLAIALHKIILRSAVKKIVCNDGIIAQRQTR